MTVSSLHTALRVSWTGPEWRECRPGLITDHLHSERALSLKSYNFETVIRLCSCLTDRQMSVWEVPWQPRRASARWLFSAEGLWTGCSGEALLGLDRPGAWYCPFREILHLLNLLPSAFWSVLLYCRMKCLIQFKINLVSPSQCSFTKDLCWGNQMKCPDGWQWRLGTLCHLAEAC